MAGIDCALAPDFLVIPPKLFFLPVELSLRSNRFSHTEPQPVNGLMPQ